jgi:DNA helicase-2/ATP-dependent DNA helicase PcrA
VRLGADFVSDLNPVQQAAVRHGDGPLLVLAGAGSGKTRVLTYRVAYLIRERHVSPRRILAVTFTNKAAGEMKKRVAALVGGDAGQAWIGTFHSMCARILRREARWGWWTSAFSIFDDSDQTDLVKKSMEKAGVAASAFSARAVLGAISRAKDRLLTAEMYAAEGGGYFEECVAKVYAEYEKGLRVNNALDFDDLIKETVQVFRANPPLLEAYAGRFLHVLVDEYQDTSHAQYALVNLLSGRHRNICVVGDDDQSIYGWRGADITNILDFEHDHPDATVLTLDQNYRSTKRILDAAHDVVSRNARRKEKKLWTEREEGSSVALSRVVNEYDEADAIRDAVLARVTREGRNYHDFAVLYRTHAQSRVIEDSLRRGGIPYDIVGGVRFYERAEVKDVLAYLRVIANPADAVSLERILNVPPRKIGDKSAARLAEAAAARGVPLLDALGVADEIEGLPAAAADSARKLAGMFDRLRKKSEAAPVDELLKDLLEETGYSAWLDGQKTEGSAQRLANVEELVSAATEFVDASGEESLGAFLEQVSLVANIDRWEDRANAVSLMTLHNAKGLEFTVVVIPGLEDGLLPHESAFADDDELEEERRLFYVGMTRAQDELCLLCADTRRRSGLTEMRVPSRFLDEIDASHLSVEETRAPTSWERAPSARTPGRRRARRTDVFPDYEDYSQEQQELSPGARVRHPSWGEGEVLEVSGVGEDTIVRVRFGDGTEKRIMVRYGKLTLSGS